METTMAIARSNFDMPTQHGNNMPTAPSHQCKLATVHRRLNGTITLKPTVVESHDSGQRVFQKILQTQRKGLRKDCRLVLFELLYTKLEIAIAEIEWAFRDPDIAERDNIRIGLRSCEPHDLFSQAIQHPRLLAKEMDFLTEYGNFVLSKADSIQDFAGQQALVVSTVVDKEKVAWLLSLALILSPSLGLIFGQFAHRLEVGIAVCALVFACATFLQGLASWLHK
ncbi:MAG: hypothetical protein Q9223_007402 [Gallowayella weberi]